MGRRAVWPNVHRVLPGGGDAMSHVKGSTLKALVQLPRDPMACWEWQGARNAQGVAQKQMGDETIPARRWMWMQLFGPIPTGMVVTTTCGSATCVNPYHLRCCFQAEACRAGAHVTLLPSDVKEIREAGKQRSMHLAARLAERYGVSQQTIRDVWARRSWRPVKPNLGPRKSRAAAGMPATTKEARQ